MFALLLAHAWIVVPVASRVVGVPDHVADAYWTWAVRPVPRKKQSGRSRGRRVRAFPQLPVLILPPADNRFIF